MYNLHHVLLVIGNSQKFKHILVDINECLEGTPPCKPYEVCVNTFGSCQCFGANVQLYSPNTKKCCEDDESGGSAGMSE